MNKFDKYNENIEKLFYQKTFRKGLIKSCKLLLSKYEQNEKDFYCFFDFLTLFEKGIYENLFEKKLSEKDKILLELNRLIKNNVKDDDVVDLITYVGDIKLEEEDIKILKTIIVKKQLSNGFFPSFASTLFDIYNQTTAFALKKFNINKDTKDIEEKEDEKGKFLV